MIVLGLDPGPLLCGAVVYDSEAETVREAWSDLKVELALDLVRTYRGTLVAVERVQSYGISGADLLATAETVGRLWQRAMDSGTSLALVYRREVLRFLDVTGRGSHDALVRQRLLEMHPGGKGTKAEPGPLYGVAGHAWQALAVAVTAAHLVQHRAADWPLVKVAIASGLGCAGGAA